MNHAPPSKPYPARNPANISFWYSTYNSFFLFFHLSAAFFKVNNCVNVDVQKNGPSAVSRYCQAGRITFPRPACQQSPVPTGCGLPAVFQSVSFVPSLPPAAENQAYDKHMFFTNTKMSCIIMFVNSYFDMYMYFYIIWWYKSYSRYTQK
jgi:hypothetical protein